MGFGGEEVCRCRCVKEGVLEHCGVAVMGITSAYRCKRLGEERVEISKAALPPLKGNRREEKNQLQPEEHNTARSPTPEKTNNKKTNSKSALEKTEAER
jgi:hypothetical protein